MTFGYVCYQLLLTIVILNNSVGLAQTKFDKHQHHNHQQHNHHNHQQHAPVNHDSHSHDLGPAGATYDLRWLDAMQQHHMGALIMSEFVFNIGEPGVGALARTIWNDQAQEIKAMGQWRKAWYPDAPVYPISLPMGADPNSIGALTAMESAQIEAMRMVGTAPNRANRVQWFLEGMLQHHGGALQMAHDALNKSNNTTIKRMARSIIIAQRREIIQLRGMLQHDGLNKPEYYKFDKLFSL
jgi:uncharacterized protein (DUF305 family)